MVARREVDAGIRALVGGEKLEQIAEYEFTLPFRYPLVGLQERLAFSDTPLADEGVDRLVRETAEAVSVDEGFFAGPYVLPEKVVSRAKAWMTPEQHETLVRFRDEQTAQNDLFAANAKAMEEGLVRKPRIIE